MKEQSLIFELNLNPEENWMLKNWGIVCNPFVFDLESKAELIRGLKKGIGKKDLPKFLPQLGLSEEVTKLILSKVKARHRYQIEVSWDGQKGSVGIKEIEKCSFP